MGVEAGLKTVGRAAWVGEAGLTLRKRGHSREPFRPFSKMLVHIWAVTLGRAGDH